MNARRWSLGLAVPALVLSALVWLGPGSPSCVPVEPQEPACVTAADCTGTSPLTCVGDWACVEGACQWQCGHPAPEGCYTDADCGPVGFCRITDDCCAPPGCLPGMVCPAVCVPCGECGLPASECGPDRPCPAGEVCAETYWCPPCVSADPPCRVACQALSACTPQGACADACDCYEQRLPFADPCPLMCALCGDYWSCDNGACVEQCGPFPDEIRACRTY
jgi:hypothetical protein